MNDDISIDEFVGVMVDRLARFREIVAAGWADGDPCPVATWVGRMEATRGTVFPGERPITYKSEWAGD